MSGYPPQHLQQHETKQSLPGKARGKHGLQRARSPLSIGFPSRKGGTEDNGEDQGRDDGAATPWETRAPFLQREDEEDGAGQQQGHAEHVEPCPGGPAHLGADDLGRVETRGCFRRWEEGSQQDERDAAAGDTGNRSC